MIVTRLCRQRPDLGRTVAGIANRVLHSEQLAWGGLWKRECTIASGGNNLQGCAPMLRIEFNGSLDDVTIRIEDRFTGAAYAKETLDLVLRHKILPNIAVNLSEMDFVAAIGEKVLPSFGRPSMKFVAERAYAINVCERLRLPVVGNDATALPRTA